MTTTPPCDLCGATDTRTAHLWTDHGKTNADLCWPTCYLEVTVHGAEIK